MTVFTEPEKIKPTYTKPSKVSPTFTEPVKTNVIYTDPIIKEATWEDIEGETWFDLEEATWADLTKLYGKKIAHPTFTEPSKGTVVYTEPSKE